MQSLDSHFVTVHVALVAIDIRIAHADSLKSKRRIVKSLKDRLRARFNVAVAEIGYLEEWQRSVVGVTMIGNDRRNLEQNYAAIEQLVLEIKDCEVLDMQLSWL
jgi:uncharacterized protein YlxP (DUF503 family)